MQDKVPVGFVGVGNIGAPMAEKIADSGFPLTIYARRAEARRHFEARGISATGSPTALGKSCGIIGVCVGDDHQLRDVVYSEGGLLAGMKPGSILMLHSTLLPSTSIEIGETAATANSRVSAVRSSLKRTPPNRLPASPD